MQKLQSEKSKSDRDTLLLKLTLWVIVIAVVGTLLCILLGILRVAIQSMLIAGGICIIVALMFCVIYERAKYRIHKAEFDHEQKKLESRKDQ